MVEANEGQILPQAELFFKDNAPWAAREKAEKIYFLSHLIRARRFSVRQEMAWEGTRYFINTNVRYFVDKSTYSRDNNIHPTEADIDNAAKLEPFFSEFIDNRLGDFKDLSEVSMITDSDKIHIQDYVKKTWDEAAIGLEPFFLFSGRPLEDYLSLTGDIKKYKDFQSMIKFQLISNSINKPIAIFRKMTTENSRAALDDMLGRREPDTYSKIGGVVPRVGWQPPALMKASRGAIKDEGGDLAYGYFMEIPKDKS